MKKRLRKCGGCGERFLLKEELEKHGDKYFCHVCLDKFYPYCDCCGNRYYRTSLRKLTGANLRYCRKCYRDETFTCDGCQIVSPRDNGILTASDTWYCNDCADNHTFFCEDCENTFDLANEEAQSVCGGDRVVCGECRDNNYTLCDGCGEYQQNDYVHYCERCDEQYCERCNHDCGGGSFREVTSSPLYGTNKGKYLIIKRLVGTEIEAEKGELCDLSEDLDDKCGIVEDGSLDSTGIEVLTPPASLNEAEKIIKDACKSLKRAGFDGTKNCGLHVHIDARDFKNNSAKLARVLRTVYAVEDLLLSMMPSSRWDNHFCLRLSHQYSFNDFGKNMKLEMFESKWYKTISKSDIDCYKTQKHDGKGTRYCGLNLHSTMYRGTIEFRYHSGTVEHQKILKWIYLLLKIINYATKRYEDKEIVSLYSQPTTQSKLRKFFEIFRIRKDIQDYIKARIKKFNPGFKYYNNGNNKIDS